MKILIQGTIAYQVAGLCSHKSLFSLHASPKFWWRVKNLFIKIISLARIKNKLWVSTRLLNVSYIAKQSQVVIEKIINTSTRTFSNAFLSIASHECIFSSFLTKNSRRKKMSSIKNHKKVTLSADGVWLSLINRYLCVCQQPFWIDVVVSRYINTFSELIFVRSQKKISSVESWDIYFKKVKKNP